MKYLRREVAKKCPVHQAVMELATDALMDKGYFSKDVIVEKAGMIAVSDAIRWDYIAEFIKSSQDCDLIPLSPKFWSMPVEKRISNPERALAGGHGKKTSGYALVGLYDGVLAVRKLQTKRAIANGTGKAFRTFADELIQRDLLETAEDQKLLESVKN